MPLHHTPLGPLAARADPRPRSALPDRLRELDFEIPLAGGDLAAAARRPAAPTWRRLLRRHLAADDPLRAVRRPAARAPASASQSLRGYLSGSIDVVLRVPDGEGHRFLVVDYKTNRLGDPDQPLTAADYARDRLAAAMLHSDYPLQALLYVVVVHRYLRWRQPGYDPATHLGGVLYLYVRGMCGAGDPAGRRAPGRGLQLAAAAGAGHRAVRPARRTAATDGDA